MHPLLPLEMPGWPPVEHPTLAMILFVILVLPLAAGAVITVIGMAPTWLRGMHKTDERSLELAQGREG